MARNFPGPVTPALQPRVPVPSMSMSTTVGPCCSRFGLHRYSDEVLWGEIHPIMETARPSRPLVDSSRRHPVVSIQTGAQRAGSTG